MKLSVLGTGYVGLVTAACFAELGHRVVGVDKNPEVIAKLTAGIPTIYEPGLEELLVTNTRTGRLRFTTSVNDAMEHGEVVFLCVGTPSLSNGDVDLSQVDEIVHSIAPLLIGYKLIVEKSTVPVTTAHRIYSAVRRVVGDKHGFDLASNPEFLREGSAIRDFLHPDRIVIGADADRARERLLELYRGDFDCPILVTDIKTAELIKHASNAFLAARISFINMVADLCERLDVDVGTLARGMGMDSRIGPRFLEAGLGYGGSCFPKDIRAFTKIAEGAGLDFALLREVERINNERVPRLLGKIGQALSTIRGKVIGVLGTAFKPNTDDIREAPSLKVIPALKEAGGILRVYDPHASWNIARVHPPDDQLCYVASVYEAAQGANGLVVLTDWEEFRSLDFQTIRDLMRTPIIIDGRNLFTPQAMREQGFDYYSMGRSDAIAGSTGPEPARVGSGDLKSALPESPAYRSGQGT